MYHACRGKGFFLPWLTFHFWAGKRGFFFVVKGLFSKEKKRDFRVLLDVDLPRRASVRLGKGVNLPTEDCCYV